MRGVNDDLRAQEIFDLATKEASRSSSLGSIPAPETKKLIESLNPGVPATVEIVRRWNPSDQRPDTFLLVWFNRGEANERFLEQRLGLSDPAKEIDINEKAVEWCNPK